MDKWKHIRSRHELEEALRVQVRFLRQSAAGYDAGLREEAIRLASVAYILLHQSRTQHSLLDAVHGLGNLAFVESAISALNDDIGEGEMPLCFLSLGSGGGRYRPYCDIPDNPSQILHGVPVERDFERWWNTAIYRSAVGDLSRKQLILKMRSQDGGGHVDPFLDDPAYFELKQKPNEYVGGAPAAPGSHFASMRQIAWELDQLLQSLGY